MTRRTFMAAAAAAAAPEERKQLRGIFPIMATPYTMVKAVDYDDLAGEVAYLDRCGVPGMVWPQLFGETFHLTREERMRGMETIARAARGRPPAIVLGVQGANLKEALGYLEKAETLDADALIALPAGDAKSVADVMAYYRALGKATRRPLFIQNADLGSGIKPGTDELIRLAQECPNCGYFKEEIEPAVPRMMALASRRPAVRRVFSGGGGRSLLYEMRLGFDGCMAGNAYADVFVQVWDDWHGGRIDRARELYGRLLVMLNAENYLKGAREYVMQKRRVFKTMVSRRYEVNLSAAEMREIDYYFEGLQSYLRK
jgi:dihydrodipicolinate synthase/N-acetylneuraminate lyase